MNIESLRTMIGPCACGRTHSLQTRELLNGAGALSELPGYVRRAYPTAGVAAVYDTNTRQVMGNTLPYREIVLPAEGLHADERGVEFLRRALRNEGVLIAVGSGTIHDIVRYACAETGADFISAPTAPSVDGFVSNVAAMTLGGRKVTTPASPPAAVFADSEVYARAPQRLAASGMGDMLGKHIALCDWECAHILAGEQICRPIVNLERQALEGLTAALKKGAGGIAYSEALMDGLLLSGIAIQLYSNSRPASGAEHHLSHLWEMEVLNGRLEALHGEKVGVGTMLAAREYKRIAKASNFTLESYQPISAECISRSFGALAEGIMSENTPDTLENIKLNEATIPQLKEVLDALPSEEELETLLHLAGAPTTMEAIGLPEELREPSLELAPYVRGRLTLLRAKKRFAMN